MALAVFNDGVRPFMLDFIQGRTTRTATTAVSFGLSAGFIFGLGAPMALSSGVLNPWLVFLPTDILGILSPKKWLAPMLGGGLGRGGRLRAQRRQQRGARAAGGLPDGHAADVDADPVPVHAVPGARDHQAVRPAGGARWRASWNWPSS